jgi:hypothetical protein
MQFRSNFRGGTAFVWRNCTFAGFRNGGEVRAAAQHEPLLTFSGRPYYNMGKRIHDGAYFFDNK